MNIEAREETRVGSPTSRGAFHWPLWGQDALSCFFACFQYFLTFLRCEGKKKNFKVRKENLASPKCLVWGLFFFLRDTKEESFRLWLDGNVFIILFLCHTVNLDC